MTQEYICPEILTLVRDYIHMPVAQPSAWSSSEFEIPIQRTFLISGRRGYDLHGQLIKALARYNLIGTTDGSPRAAIGNDVVLVIPNVDLTRARAFANAKGIMDVDTDACFRIGEPVTKRSRFVVALTHAQVVHGEPFWDQFDEHFRISPIPLSEVESAYRARFAALATHLETCGGGVALNFTDEDYAMLRAASAFCTHTEIQKFMARVAYECIHRVNGPASWTMNGVALRSRSNGLLYWNASGDCSISRHFPTEYSDTATTHHLRKKERPTKRQKTETAASDDARAQSGAVAAASSAGAPAASTGSSAGGPIDAPTRAGAA